ncbi:MAG: type II secretion system F family protein [Planctomycetes bacterium]|nr:type II secretion system F family protein [Planctomycetota bacterium]
MGRFNSVVAVLADLLGLLGIGPLLLLLLAYVQRDRSVQLQVLCRHLAVALRRNLPLPGALAALAADTASGFARRLRALRTHLESGKSLGAALELFPAHFPRPFARAVAAGERCGRLEPVLEEFAESQEQSADFFSALYRSAAYFVFVALLGYNLVQAHMTYVEPSFSRVLSDMKVTLEAPDVSAWQAGVALGASGFCLVLILLPVARKLAGYGPAAVWWLRFPLDVVPRLIPYVWTLLCQAAAVRFCRVLALLLRGGVPMTEAMRHACALESDAFLRLRFGDFRARWERGETLGAAARAAGLDPGLAWMLGAGERAGDLPDLLGVCAAQLQERMRGRLERLRQSVHPILVLLAASIVATHVLVSFSRLAFITRVGTWWR